MKTKMKRSIQWTMRFFSAIWAFTLLGCASSNQEMMQRMDQWESETREEMETLKRAVEASYDRERTLAERLRQLEENHAQLRQDLHVLREQNAAIRAQLDSLQTSLPAESPPSLQETDEFDVLQTYRSALEQYRNHHYQEALEQFSKIIDQAPYSEWADNAQYWKGECYYGLGKFHRALTEFTKVFAYQKTEKADDAQLKIARCYMNMGEKEKALAAFQKLLDEYPKSEYAPQARKQMKYLQGP